MLCRYSDPPPSLGTSKVLCLQPCTKNREPLHRDFAVGVAFSSTTTTTTTTTKSHIEFWKQMWRSMILSHSTISDQ